MSEYTPEQQAVVEWFEDPKLLTPSADEVERRFREVGLRSTGHAQDVIAKVKKDNKPKK